MSNKQPIFTRRGWIDEDGYMPYALIEQREDGTIVHSLAMKKSPERTCCFYDEIEEMPLPHSDEVATFILAIAQGQRASTPPSKSKFVGRYDKTFFSSRGKNRISYTLRYEHAINACSLANYVQSLRRDPECGVVERLYDEYCFVIGNLAYTLVATSQRLAALREANLDREKTGATKISSLPEFKVARYMSSDDKLNVTMQHCLEDEELLVAMTENVKDPDEAVKIVVGAMLCCYMRDHSAIQKDRKSNKIKKALDMFGDAVERFEDAASKNCDKNEMRLNADAFEALKKIAELDDETMHVIPDGADEFVQWISSETRFDRRRGVRDLPEDGICIAGAKKTKTASKTKTSAKTKTAPKTKTMHK